MPQNLLSTWWTDFTTKFVKFLTDKIANTDIPIWVALAAGAALIVILAIIIIVSVAKKDRKAKKAKLAAEKDAIVAVDAPSDIPLSKKAQKAADKKAVADAKQAAADEKARNSKKGRKAAERLAIELLVAEQLAAANNKNEAVTATPVAPIQVADPIVAPQTEPVYKQSAEKATEQADLQSRLSAINAVPTQSQYVARDTVAQAPPVVQAPPVAQAPPVVQAPQAYRAPQVARTEATTDRVTLPAYGLDTNDAKSIARPLVKATPVLAPRNKPQPIYKEPVAKTAPVAKAAPAPKSPAVELTDEEKESFGKYIIISNDSNPLRPFSFALIANNGQLLFESEPFKQKPRQASIDAFERHVNSGLFIVDEDKAGNFRYKLYSNKNVLIGVGESYKSRASCENSIESVKRFSTTATYIEDKTAE